jgi:hypothetical protein
LLTRIRCSARQWERCEKRRQNRPKQLVAASPIQLERGFTACLRPTRFQLTLYGTAIRAQCRAKSVDATAGAYERYPLQPHTPSQRLYRRPAQRIFSIAIALPAWPSNYDGSLARSGRQPAPRIEPTPPITMITKLGSGCSRPCRLHVEDQRLHQAGEALARHGPRAESCRGFHHRVRWKDNQQILPPTATDLTSNHVRGSG